MIQVSAIRDMKDVAAMPNTGLDIWQRFDDVVVLNAVHRLRMIDDPKMTKNDNTMHWPCAGWKLCDVYVMPR